MKRDEDRERAAIIDEFGEVARKVAEFKPTADRYDQLRKQIAGWYNSHPADQAFEAEGKQYTVQVGMRGLVRRIVNTAKLYAILGKARFIEMATVKLEDVDRAIPDPTAQTAFMVSERTGSRKVTPVAKAVPAAAATPGRRAKAA